MNEPDGHKPPYRVPSMAEIAATPWNGRRVVSTFSGCGGSCLGFRMAGFRVVWASEFVPAAQETYRANHPGAHLDTRDIREVRPEDILEQTGLAAGEVDVMEGSPPCASFSTAGKRQAGWGQVRPYSDTRQRTDDLFFEFARVLRGVRPKVFVAENVSGLVKGTAKGYFKDILRALKGCGYVVEARLLDAQWLGVPQARQRVIFVGVREDLGVGPAFPKPLPYRYSVRDALPGIASQHWDGKGAFKAIDRPATEPSLTITVNNDYQLTACEGVPPVEPEAAIGRFAIGREYDNVPVGGNSARYFNLARPDPDKPCPTVTQTGGTTGAAAVVHPTQRRKFTIAELKRLCSFPDDFTLTGSYSQRWERLGRAVPPVMMCHVARAVEGVLLCAG